MHFQQILDASRLLAFLEDTELKFCELTEAEFIALGCAGTYKYLGYNEKKKYSISVGRENTDYYVRQALKLWDVKAYKEHFGYTRKAVYGIGLNALLQNARPVHPITNLKSDAAAYHAYLLAIEDTKKFLWGLSPPEPALPDMEAAATALPTNTSAGYSYPGKKKGEVRVRATRKAQRMFDSIAAGEKTYKVPSTLALRGHLSPIDKVKSRVIVVYPYEVQLLEARLYKPLYHIMKRESKILSGKGSLHRLYRYIHSHNNRVFVNMDISKWDRLRAIFLIRQSFKLFNSMIKMTKEEKKVAKWVENYLVDTPFALPSGHHLLMKGGIPSGTFLTLLINTTCNYMSQATVLRYLGIQYYDLQVLGDDCAFFLDTRDEFKYDEISKYNMKFFYHEVSVQKSVVTRKVWDRKFIGYTFRSLRLYRPSEEFFRSALYPERDVKNVAISFSRMFAYMCIGGVNDTKFFSFFEFFCTVYQQHLRKYEKKMFRREAFRFGSLRVFKDVLDFREDEVINLNFDQFMTYIDWNAIPFMFSVGCSIRKE